MRLTDGAPLYLVESEEMVIGGALMAHPDDVQGIVLSPRDFRDTSLGAIWAAIREGLAEDSDCSIPVVAWKLDRRGWLDRVGAEPRLVDLAGRAMYQSSPACLAAHAAIVRDWSARRAFVAQAAEQVKAVYANGVPATTPVYERPEYQGIEF